MEDKKANLQDTRLRSWINSESRVSKVLKLLIELEDELCDLDEVSLDIQKFYEIEDFSNKVWMIRLDFTTYVDEHPDILKIK